MFFSSHFVLLYFVEATRITSRGGRHYRHFFRKWCHRSSLFFDSVDAEVVFFLQYVVETTWMTSRGGRHYREFSRSAVNTFASIFCKFGYFSCLGGALGGVLEPGTDFWMIFGGFGVAFWSTGATLGRPWDSHGHPLDTIGSPLTSLFSEKCLKKQLLEYVTLRIPFFIDF